MYIKLVLVIIAVILFWFLLRPPVETPAPSPIPHITYPKIQSGIPMKHIPDVVKYINDKNEKVKSISCTSMQITVTNKNGRCGATGQVYYIKDKNFRLVIDSFCGKTLDIGSNQDIFWFWINGYEPDAIFYARHGHHTRLKSVFMPQWFIEAFGINKIDETSAFTENGNILYASKNVISTAGTKLTYTAVIDKQDKVIKGYYLFDKSNNILLQTEIEYINDLPSEVNVLWTENNVYINMNLSNVEVNLPVDSSNFVLPTYKRTIDMENY